MLRSVFRTALSGMLSTIESDLSLHVEYSSAEHEMRFAVIPLESR